MIILGIDPGLAATGYGCIRNTRSEPECISYGCIYTEKYQPLSERLFSIHKQLQKILKKHKPERAAVEELFFYKNLKTAIHVGHVRGVVLLTLREANIPLIEITPLQVKQSTTGYGKATKQQIQYMVQKILKLADIPKSDDAADALACALVVSNYDSRLHVNI